MKKILAKIAGISMMFAMTFGTSLATSPNTTPICHATGSENNPYNVIYVDPNGYNGHGDHDGDIIPITDLNGDQVINDLDCGFSDENDTPQDSVCTEANLLVNGGFEAPVAPAGGWDEYDSGTPGLGWTVAWNGAFVGAPAIAKLELHNGVGGWLPEEGSQHAELDADWGMNDGEQASVAISQDVATVPGATYSLSYAFSPRPGTPAGENVLEVLVDGTLVQTQGPVAGAGNTSWTTYSYNFVANDGSANIMLRDAGTPNTLGTFLDDVSVNCVEDPEVCTEVTPLFARINMKTDDATKLRNWGAGDMAANVYVGGNAPANQYDIGEWFPLTNPDGSFINDVDLTTYRDVPGLAVQRISGKVRVVLYGFHESEAAGKELAAGSIELSSDPALVKTRLLGAWTKGNGYVDPMDAYTRAHDVSVDDAANQMDGRGDFVGNINQYNPRFDNVRVFQDLFQFHLVATTNSDGFYGEYDFDPIDESPCECDYPNNNLIDYPYCEQNTPQ